MSLGRAAHPARLPWFAGGCLDRAQAAAIERHLETCDDCRAEVQALRSLYRSLHDEAPSGHVSPALLVAYHAGTPGVSEDDRRLVERHVRECHTCSADLLILERADAPVRTGARQRFLGAAASVVLVVAAGWMIAGRRAESPAPQTVARVVFQPTQRGTSGDPRLTGSGPWELEVWLPLHAVAPSYLARIQRTDQPSSTAFETIVAAGPRGGSVLVPVPGGLLRPGRHVLSLIPRGGDRSGTDVHGFDVLSSP